MPKNVKSLYDLTILLFTQIMRIHRSTKPLERFCALNKQVLTQVDKAKYLGVMITDNLNWKSHINRIVSKAIKYLGLIKRTSAIAHMNSESWLLIPSETTIRIYICCMGPISNKRHLNPEKGAKKSSRICQTRLTTRKINMKQKFLLIIYSDSDSDLD